MFARVYDKHMETDPAPLDSHRLAVLCFVLGLGALLDLDQPYMSQESTRYYQLGRAALSLDSILESQSIPAIQALVRAPPDIYTVTGTTARAAAVAVAPMSTDPCSSHVNRSSCATSCSFPS